MDIIFYTELQGILCLGLETYALAHAHIHSHMATTGYTMKGRAHAASQLNLIIAIRQQNTNLLLESLEKGHSTKSLTDIC